MAKKENDYYWFTQVSTDPFDEEDIRNAAERKIDPAILIKYWQKRNGEHFYVWQVHKTEIWD